MHGHNWKVQVVIEGEKLDETGMLVDFLDVKSFMGEILDRLDHQFLNEIPPVRRSQPLSRKHRRIFLSGDDAESWKTRPSPCASAK